jgi:hypothetical protein
MSNIIKWNGATATSTNPNLDLQEILDILTK